ncbi:MAG: ATP-binding protein [Acidimicrobiales bacterium]
MSDDAPGLDTLNEGDRVQLTFPARGDLVVLARLVSSAISARSGFDIEELEDLRLAVGELCLLALHGSDGPRGELRVDFVCTRAALEISCTLIGAVPGPAPEAGDGAAHQLSEQILAALVDEHGQEHHEGQAKAWLRKRRPGPLA